MKKLFSLLILFSIFSFAQQNPFSGKFSPSIDGMMTFSYSDYKSSVPGIGLNIQGDYYLPMKGYSTVGFRLTMSRFRISGEDPDKFPDRFYTNLYGTGLGVSFLHSQENFFFKSLYAGISYLWFDPMIEAGRPSPNNLLNVYSKSSISYDLMFGLEITCNRLARHK
jgi:hypothetical protein